MDLVDYSYLEFVMLTESFNDSSFEENPIERNPKIYYFNYKYGQSLY